MDSLSTVNYIWEFAELSNIRLPHDAGYHPLKGHQSKIIENIGSFFYFTKLPFVQS